MKHKKKRHITLIEIMIVMFLIALITGVIAYNYRGSLEEGKAFKTRTAKEKLETILNLAISENPSLDIESDWKEIIVNSPLVQNSDALIKDGWGDLFIVHMDHGVITVHSNKLTDYENKRKKSFK